MPTQIPMFAPTITAAAPRPNEWPRFRDASIIAVDLECKDEDIEELGPGCYRDDSYVCGIGVAIDHGPSVYLPVKHHGGGNVENPEAAWAWFRDNAGAYEGKVLGCNRYYDFCWEKVNGVLWPKAKRHYCVQILDTLINELERSARLDALCKRWGVPGKDKTALIEAAKAFGLKNPMAEMWKLPAGYVIPYNLSDTAAPLALFPKMMQKIAAMSLEELCDIEARVTPIIVDMRHRGVKVNEKKLQEIETWSIVEEKVQIAKIKHLTNRDVHLDSFNTNAAIGPVLESVGVAVPRGKKGKYKITENFLEHCPHELGKIVLRGKQMTNLRAKFSRPAAAHITKGRIHCVYNQTRSPKGDRSLEMVDDSDEDEKEENKGTRTGRFSAEHTNLTQVPSRQDWSTRFKDIFEPEEGYHWFSADFSQQEPRLATHWAAKLDLPGARKVAQAYHDDPLLDNHDYMSQQTGLERKRAKSIYLGLIYSMGEAKLCRELGLPTQYSVSWGPWRDKQERFFDEEWKALAFRQGLHEDNVYVYECAGTVGKEIIRQFHERAPFLRGLIQAAKKSGAKYGEIITLLGRHLHLPLTPGGKYDWVHKCLNMLIQGSAADQVKKSLVDTIEQIPHLYLQLVVHDSLQGSTKSRQEILSVVNIMRNAVISEYVPYRVDKTIGPSWGREMDLCYHHTCIEDAISSKKKYCPKHAPIMTAA